MKTLKRLSSMLLAVFMVMAMAIPAFAADHGKITISNPTPGNTYKIYKVFDAAGNGSSISYKLVDGKTTAPACFDVDSAGNVTYSGTGTGGQLTADDIAAIADYVTESDLFATKPANEGDTTVVFQDLPNGYYYITTTTGTVVTIDSTNPDAEVHDKNEKPEIAKEVEENSVWGDTSYAAIGDTVNFRTTVTAQKGALNYVVHDTMSDGLTFKEVTSVKGGENTLTKGSDYSVVTTDLTDGCDFEIRFAQNYLDTIDAQTNIVIEYSATLNEDAEISDSANTNTTYLRYGKNNENVTQSKSTNTYTFMFDLVKTDNENNILTGAEFELYDAQNDGKKIDLVKDDDGTYRVATAGEAEVEGFTSAVIKAGNVTIKGLDGNTTYWLEETKAPDGYNKLTERSKVEIKTDNLTATIGTDNKYQSGGVQVVNQAGTELPSTGGMGTTIFYIAGTVLVLGAGVILVTRRRMSR